MIFRALAIALLLWQSTSSTPEAALPYFSNLREVAVPAPAGQSYAVVDAEIWARSRSDLGDLRLYTAAGDQVPYALRVERATSTATEIPAKVLDLGTSAGATSFVLDMQGVQEYDRITLQLESKDFIAKAAVDGLDDLQQTQPSRLGVFTLYDFSHEKLGSNSVLQLPLSRFRYLRVRIAGGVRPDEVKGATAANVQEKKAVWTEVPATPAISREGKTTVIAFAGPPGVPLDRLVFAVEPQETNFLRELTVLDADGGAVASGEISRIHLTRGDKVVESEALAVDVGGIRSPRYRVVIQNHDDPPLRLLGVKAFSLERRVYFDAHGNATLRLYYGDPKLEPPTYEYAQLFSGGAGALAAQLGPGQHNPGYTGRPDDRPWSEQHPVVLWVALGAAVLVLAILAVRALKS